MNSHKISVIVPIYKVEQYLNRCVKSIVDQTYKNLEILLIDDESPDRCPQICDEWAMKDNRIIVIHKPNGGVSDARNLGLDKATGDFISFIDSDDFVANDFIETLYNLCIEHECDIAQCDSVKVYNNDGITPCTEKDNVRTFNNIEMLYNFYDNDLHIQTCVVWSKLYKKHLFENIRFKTGIRYEDELILPGIIYAADKVAVSSKKTYVYYQRGDSFMCDTFDRRNLELIGILEERIRFFNDKNLMGLKDRAIVRYCYMLIEFYNKSKRYIPDCQDVLNEIMSKYKDAYKNVITQKRLAMQLRIRYALYRFSPRVAARLWKGWACGGIN